jgi:alpha-2-macroglobulin
VKEAALKIYRVDLMKLHERQKVLTAVSGVNLSGITPEAELTLPLGDGLDYSWKKKVIDLPMKAEGAYLVICRGDSEMSSGLVLLTTLTADVHAAPGEGSLRVQIRDSAKGIYVADAEVAAYDSASNGEPNKGRSDPRGLFSASGIDGYATVVVKLGDSRYAYHRTPYPLRPTAPVSQQSQQQAKPINAPAKAMDKSDYLMNVRQQFMGNTFDNKEAWGKKMKSGGKGVEAEKAFKK